MIMYKFNKFLILFLITTFGVSIYPQRGASKIVKTGIAVNYRARIAVGDSIIAYGTGPVKGVDYIKAGDAKGQGIPGGENFSNNSFATLSGDRIVLTKTDDFSLHLFDAKTGKISEISGVKLKAIGGSMRYGGAIQADGDFLIALTESAQGDQITIIDFSGNAPVVTNYKNWKQNNYLKQMAIDAESGWAAVQGSEEMAAFMFKSGDGKPLVHGFKDKGGAETDQMKIDGEILYYFGAKSTKSNLFQMNLRTGEIKQVGEFPAAPSVGANDGTVAYFLDRDAKDKNGTEARLAVMKKGGTPVVAAPTDRFIDGSTKNNGIIGFGNMIAVTPDGKYVFIAGNESVGRTEILQYYDGAGVKLVNDGISATSPKALPGSDIVANSSLVAFKIGTDNNTSLAYIKLK